MSEIIPNAAYMTTYTVKSTDGFTEPITGGGYLTMTNYSGTGTKATVQVISNGALVPLKASTAQEANYRSTKETEFFLDPNNNATSALIGIVAGNAGNLAAGPVTYTAMDTVAQTGRGSGATFTVTAAVAAGSLVPTAITVVDHGSGYKEDDIIRILLVDGDTSGYLEVKPSVASTMGVYGYATSTTDTAYTGDEVQGSMFGSGGTVNCTAVHVSASTNGPSYSYITDIDTTTTRGQYYRQGEEVYAVLSDDITVYFTLGEGVGVDSVLQVEMTEGITLPFIITSFKNMEGSDGSFILVS